LTLRKETVLTGEGAMRCGSWRLVGYLALILALTAGGCAYLEARSTGQETPAIDTMSGRTGGGGGGGGGGGY